MGRSRFWFSCRDMAELLDSPEQLPVLARVGVLLHLFLCYACRVYRRQLTVLKLACRRAHHERAPSAESVRALEDRVLRSFGKDPE